MCRGLCDPANSCARLGVRTAALPDSYHFRWGGTRVRRTVICAHCAVDFPSGLRAERCPCCRRSVRRPYRQDGSVNWKVRHDRRQAARRRAARHASYGCRSCAECGAPIPQDAHGRRVLCGAECYRRRCDRLRSERRLCARTREAAAK